MVWVEAVELRFGGSELGTEMAWTRRGWVDSKAGGRSRHRAPFVKIEDGTRLKSCRDVQSRKSHTPNLKRETIRLTKILLKTGPSCSETHVPGYINSEKAKEAGQIFVVSGMHKTLFQIIRYILEQSCFLNHEYEDEKETG